MGAVESFDCSLHRAEVVTGVGAIYFKSAGTVWIAFAFIVPDSPGNGLSALEGGDVQGIDHKRRSFEAQHACQIGQGTTSLASPSLVATQFLLCILFRHLEQI
jgi:hypothetical protein